MNFIEANLKDFYGPARQKWLQQLSEEFSSQSSQAQVTLLKALEGTTYHSLPTELSAWTTHQRTEDCTHQAQECEVLHVGETARARESHRMAQLKNIRQQIYLQIKLQKGIEKGQSRSQPRKSEGKPALVRVVENMPPRSSSMNIKKEKPPEPLITANVLHSLMTRYNNVRTDSLKTKILKQAIYMPKSKLRNARENRPDSHKRSSNLAQAKLKPQTLSLRDLIRL